MRVICAWCGKIIIPGPDEYAEVSHGICTECCEIERNKIKAMEKERQQLK